MDVRLALLLACFFLSGFAALLYQTVWTRELSFVFGTSELAVAAVLAAYMGGLALGAAAAGRYALRLRRPVLAYGVLELAIALCALSVPAAIRGLEALYVALLGGATGLGEGGSGVTTAFQLGAAFAVLLPPTAFMGATLPLLARHAVRREAEIGSRVGLLYAVNTVGAIVGTLCAAFWLMPELGLRRTVHVGAGLNGLVFALAALLARHAAMPLPDPHIAAAPPRLRARWVLPAMAVSGSVSFAYEVLWTRLLGHLLGASLDAFATMLASFLLGIALGSAIAARVARRRERAAPGFAFAQLGIACSGYGVFAAADHLPALSAALGAGPGETLASAAVAGGVLLPVTLCIGATFPFAVRLLAERPEDASAAAARAYAWNTVGAIAGALGAGFVLLPGLGFEGTVAVGVALSLGLAGLTAIASTPPRRGLVALAAAGLLALAARPPQAPWTLLSSSPLESRMTPAQIRYAAVGRSSTVMLFDLEGSFRLQTNGLPEALIEGDALLPVPNTARLLGALPALLRPDAREMLVVGLGGATALEAVPSSITSIDVVELEPEVLEANRRIAGERAIDPLADPRVHVHIGDARGVLQLTQRRFDAVVSQPSHPWTAGASHLYTREFFDLVRSRLKPAGVFIQWIGLQYVDEALLRALTAALVAAFDHVEVYQFRGVSAVVFAASDAPLDALDGVRRALRRAPDELGRFGIHRVEDVAAMRVLDEAGSRAFPQGAAPNTDDANLLAARASHLGDAALDGRDVQALWKPYDPVLSEQEGLDRSALIRILAATNAEKRATALALAGTGAAEEVGLGWIELGLGRAPGAARHFGRALELDPASREAAAGLLLSRPADFERVAAAKDLSPDLLDEGLAALRGGQREALAGHWEGVAARDAALAGVQPGGPGFEEATRLRIRWRLEAHGADAEGRAAEAQSLAETLLVRRWTSSDALLHARAAIAAGRPRVAQGTLVRLAQTLALSRSTSPLADAVAQSALEVAQELPEELAAEVRVRLQRRGVPRPRFEDD